MTAPFSRTTRSLAATGPGPALLAWGLAAVLLALWLGWFVLGRVAVVETSRSARVEVQRVASPVSALVAGRIESSPLRLGQAVRAGEVLLRLDAQAERLRLQEEQSRLEAYGPRIAALEREMAALRQAQGQDQQSAEAALRAAQARSREAAGALDFAREQARRLREDSQAGGASALDALRAGAEAQRQAAAQEALRAEAARLQGDARSRRSQQQAALEALERAQATLEGEHAALQAGIARLEQALGQYELRAPIDGVIGELQPLAVGGFVAAGQQVATVVPPGELRIVAEFAPSAALGRLRVGQAARMRLDGFPWTEYGSLPAEVRSVAAEVREQTVRVELRPLPEPGSRIVLQHGLPGVVEVRIGDSSPLDLVLRSVGRMGRP